jgi:hypothetical protein
MLKWWIMLLQHRRTERQEKRILRQWKNQIMLRRLIQSRLAKRCRRPLLCRLQLRFVVTEKIVIM